MRKGSLKGLVRAGTWAEAIEAAYAAFDYPPPRGALEVAPTHDDGERMFADLTSAPLRDLTWDKLTAFEGSAISTAGTVGDFKHFLPRIMELMVPTDGYGFDASIVAGKLRYAGWEHWAPDEIAAVRDVFRTAVRQALCIAPGQVLWSDLLEGNVMVGNMLAEVLAGVAPEDGLDEGRAVLNLADLVMAAVTPPRHKWQGFKAEDQAAVAAWVKSPQVANALLRGVDCVPETEAYIIEAALSVVS